MSRAPWNNVLHPAAGAAGLPLVTASAAAGHRRLQARGCGNLKQRGGKRHSSLCCGAKELAVFRHGKRRGVQRHCLYAGRDGQSERLGAICLSLPTDGGSSVVRAEPEQGRSRQRAPLVPAYAAIESPCRCTIRYQ